MAEYIDRQAAIEKLISNLTYMHTFGADRSIDLIEELPSADVQSVRHGHWETINGWDGDELYRCSECGAEFVLIYGTPKDNGYWFCPHCGADMRGEQDG